MSLVADLFPNVAFEKTAYHELTEAIRVEVESQGLVYHEPWVLKLIQVILKSYCLHNSLFTLSVIYEDV